MTIDELKAEVRDLLVQALENGLQTDEIGQAVEEVLQNKWTYNDPD